MARKTVTTIILATALAVFAVTPALAGVTASQIGYANVGPSIQNEVADGPSATAQPASDSGPGATPRSASGSSLPFTGLDVAMVLSIGVVLMLGGFGLSRIVTLNQRRQEGWSPDGRG